MNNSHNWTLEQKERSFLFNHQGQDPSECGNAATTTHINNFTLAKRRMKYKIGK